MYKCLCIDRHLALTQVDGAVGSTGVLDNLKVTAALHVFRDHWSHVDRHSTGTINSEQLAELLEKLPQV